jgi:hypothetical protein
VQRCASYRVALADSDTNAYADSDTNAYADSDSDSDSDSDADADSDSDSDADSDADADSDSDKYPDHSGGWRRDVHGQPGCTGTDSHGHPRGGRTGGSAR